MPGRSRLTVCRLRLLWGLRRFDGVAWPSAVHVWGGILLALILLGLRS